jgi:mycothiol synthase
MGPSRELPEGFGLRSVSVKDAPAIVEVINDCMVAEIGRPWTTVEETRDDLTSPGRDNARDDALLVAGDGTPVGYLQLGPDVAPFTSIMALVFVRPHLWGRGLSAWLIRLGEERARAKVHLAPAGERMVVRVARFADNEPAERLFGSLGYTYVRTFWMMQVDLCERPPAPRVPGGIRIRRFELGRDERAVHAALSEAFADHWGHPFPSSFEQWRHRELEGEGSGFDPSLWFVALDGDEVVGAACCRASTARQPDAAAVDSLAVRRGWRGRGVGLALLLSAFGALHERGIPRAELGVDAANPTGATRLYRRAGMDVAYAWEFWEKELRPASGPDP